MAAKQTFNKAKGKKTRQGTGRFSKYGMPGPHGGNKTYKKKPRGQGSGKR